MQSKMSKTKTITASIEMKVSEALSREQISDIIMQALKPYNPFIEDINED